MNDSPTLSDGPLHLWAIGRASVDSARRWPSDILNVSFSLMTDTTRIIVQGVRLAHVDELRDFVKTYNQLEIQSGADFRLEFKPLLGCLRWYISRSKKGGIFPQCRMTIYYSKFRRDTFNLPRGERHGYWINLTDDELAQLIQSCRNVIKMFPVRYG